MSLYYVNVYFAGWAIHGGFYILIQQITVGYRGRKKAIDSFFVAIILRKIIQIIAYKFRCRITSMENYYMGSCLRSLSFFFISF